MLIPCRLCSTFVLAVSAMFVQAQTTSALPEIAPGLTLPVTGTVVALDTAETTPTRVVIHATEIKSNSHASGNFARSMVYAGPRSGIELAGDHAAVTLKSAAPVFFIRLPADDPETQRNRVSLLMMRVQKDSREVMQMSANVFGGSHKRRLEEIPIQKEDVADGAWLKVTPKEKLEPGEYGIVFLPKDSQLFTEVVYDFSIAGAR